MGSELRPEQIHRELDKALTRIAALERALVRQAAAREEHEQRMQNLHAFALAEQAKTLGGNGPRSPVQSRTSEAGFEGADLGLSLEQRLAKLLVARRRATPAAPPVPEPARAPAQTRQGPDEGGRRMQRAMMTIQNLDRGLRHQSYLRAKALIAELSRARKSEGDHAAAQRQEAELFLIRASGLFDDERYRKKMPSAANPTEHYLSAGLDGDINPHPVFAHRWYITKYAKLLVGWTSPFAHFLAVGWKKGCDPHPLFPTKWYLTQYDDVRRSGQNPFEHFMTVGHTEGRKPNSVFETGWYRDEYLADRPLSTNPLIHYVFGGRGGEFEPCEAFDTRYLIAEHPLVGLAEANPLAYLLELDEEERLRLLTAMRGDVQSDRPAFEPRTGTAPFAGAN